MKLEDEIKQDSSKMVFELCKNEVCNMGGEIAHESWFKRYEKLVEEYRPIAMFEAMESTLKECPLTYGLAKKMDKYK